MLTFLDGVPIALRNRHSLSSFDCSEEMGRKPFNKAQDADHRDLYAGLIRLHVLHHAVKEPVYGLAMIEELRR